MRAVDRSPFGWAPIVAILAAAVAVAYAYVLFGGQTFGGEHLLVEIPSRTFLADSIASGRVPEWWPHVGLGLPFAANPDHLALYPPAWIVAVLPMPWAADLLITLHALFAGVGTAVVASRLGADRFGAVIAGGAFATCGVVSGSVDHAATVLSLAWVPWMLVIAVDIAHVAAWRDRAVHAVWMSCATAAALLAGDLSVAVVGALLAVAVSFSMSYGRSLMCAATAAVGSLGGVVPAAVLLVPAASLGLLTLDTTGQDLTRLVGYVWPGAAATPAYVGLPIVALVLVSAVTLGHARRLAAVAVVAAGLGAGVWEPFIGGAGVLLCALGGVGATEVARWCGGRARLERTLPAAIGALAVGATIASGLARTDLRSRADIGDRPVVLPASVNVSPPPRVYRPLPGVVGRSKGRPTTVEHALAPANTATRFGFAYARGHDRAMPHRVHATWLAAAVASESFFDLYDVEYMLVPASVVFPSGMIAVERSPDGRLALVHNKLRRPRAFVAPRWRWHADDAALRGHLFAPGRGLRLGTVQLIGDGTAWQPRDELVPAPACGVEYSQPERVRLTCKSTSGGYAVLLDGWSPGWSATVDGADAKLLRADSLVRAVQIAPGAHVVQMHYQTPGLRTGAIVSFLAFLNALVLVFVRRRRTSVTRGSDT